MRARTLVSAALLGLVAVPAAGDAQAGGGAQRRGAQGAGRGGAAAEQRMGQVLREQLQLTDAQAVRLQETTQKFNPRRVALVEEERRVRQTMREALCTEDQSRPAEVSRWIDQMLDLEKRRIELRIEEQRDLSAFLTPYQRARFLGTLELVQRRLEGQPGPGGRGGPPPAGQGRGRGGPPGGRVGPPLDACGNPLPGRGGRGRGG